MPTEGHCFQITGKGCLCHAVEYKFCASPLGNAFRFTHKVLLRVQDHMVCARFCGYMRLLFCRHGSDNRCSEMLRPLDQQKSYTPCGSMDQDRISGLWLAKFMNKVVRSHPLKWKSSTLFKGKPIRKTD